MSDNYMRDVMVVGCARCGKTHQSMDFEHLWVPIEDSEGGDWTHWSPCPENGQPVLLRVS